MRLARYLAQCGVASRRASENYITDGEVTVNGSVVTKVGTTVDPTSDVVLFRGKRVAPDKLVYYVVHKPVGYVCSTKDAHAEKLVTDLVPDGTRLYPVGRLDKDSSGLVILTNDGELAQQMAHPKYEKKKVYEVQIEGVCSVDFLKCMQRGVRLDEGLARADSFSTVSTDSAYQEGILRLTSYEK